MNETEISNYLNDNPLPINQHGFLSGRHRVAAMIGRILRGENIFLSMFIKHKKF